MTYGELKILAYVWIENHDIDIFNRFILPRFTVEKHGLGSISVKGITGTQRSLLSYWMREQFGFLFHNTRLVKHAFPLDVDQINGRVNSSKIDIVRSYRSASVPPLVMTSRNG